MNNKNYNLIILNQIKQINKMRLYNPYQNNKI